VGNLIGAFVIFGLLLVLLGVSTRNDVDLYTGMGRTRFLIFGFLPLPSFSSTSEHVEWALANMPDPTKRRWTLGSTSSTGLLGGLHADAFPFSAVRLIHDSALPPEEKLELLQQYHGELDALTRTGGSHTILMERWREKLKPPYENEDEALE